MACFKPLHGWKKLGSDGITFDPNNSAGIKMRVPCGQCIGCRVEHSRAWATRCVHEAETHESACFLTLTYADEHLPQYGELRPDHWQKFIKKLRKRLNPRKIRYFHCGEYGEENQRPHYHALLFGWEPTDKVLHSTRDQVPLYTSEYLEKLWGKGFVTIGEVTPESAAYVARYTMKKLTGERYFTPVIDFSTGEINELQNVYATMSRRPGIGQNWLNQYKTDVYPDDFVVLPTGSLTKVPRYYDKLLERAHQEEYQVIKQNRKDRAKKYAVANTPQALEARREHAEAKLNKLVRTL